jgi:hypothetical protein
MRRTSLVLGCLLIVMACAATPVAAQAPTRDSVTGTATSFAGPGVLVTYTLDASSGPTGEDPAGSVRIDLFGPVDNPVTCLDVQGNRAIVGIAVPSDPPGGLWIFVTDTGDVGPDTIGAVGTATPPDVCSEQPHSEAEAGGNIVVVDAQPSAPTSKEQCKNGGWRNFQQFKNEGQCIKFVKQGP